MVGPKKIFLLKCGFHRFQQQSTVQKLISKSEKDESRIRTMGISACEKCINKNDETQTAGIKWSN